MANHVQFDATRNVYGAYSRARLAELHRGNAIAAATSQQRFLQAYRASRLAASALLPVRPPRRSPANVWRRLEIEVPDLAPWAQVLSGYARLAADVEDGLPRTIGEHFANDFLWAVGQFLDQVDMRLGILAGEPITSAHTAGCTSGTSQRTLV